MFQMNFFSVQNSGPGSSSGEAKVWGPRRNVEIKRVEGKSLGLSIVGGKVDGVNSGIFVKNVLADSPAGATGQLFTGDRILQVGTVTLTSSEQKVAVEAIKSSGDPIRLVVQSLQPSSSKVVALSLALFYGFECSFYGLFSGLHVWLDSTNLLVT